MRGRHQLRRRSAWLAATGGVAYLARAAQRSGRRIMGGKNPTPKEKKKPKKAKTAKA
jgi:hypothetical protein